MNTACCTNSTKSSPYDLGTFQQRSLTRASIDVQTSAAVSLVTADGDKVTLNASSSLQANSQTYDFLGRSQGQTVAAHGEAFQLSASSGFAISVEGSLDKEELNDIRQLLNTLSSVSRDLFAGNNQAGLQHLTQLADLDSIASFEANFNYTKQITALASSQVTTTANSPGSGTSSATAAAPSQAGAAPDSFIEQLSRAAKRLNAEDGIEKIPKRFAQMFTKLAHQLRLDDHEEKLAKRIAAEHSRGGREHRGDESTQVRS